MFSVAFKFSYVFHLWKPDNKKITFCHIENTYMVLPYIKNIISPNRVRYFWYTTTLCTYSINLSTSDLLSFVMSNTDKHEFSSIWKWISYSNDVINHVDCVIKHDVYPQKIHSCSKNIHGISVFVLEISSMNNVTCLRDMTEILLKAV